ncbi:MAG TPA: medium chain dehydrogenase/reductase family protein [Polyangiaceae bacterium]|nr:medium chain dehydrogenase/reductase family protein [Polyangiaceae bacterium]
MRHVVIRRPGGHDRLSIERGPDREPGPGEVAVEVEAAGVNYADCVVRMGLYASAKKYVGWPITPGFEFAGRVAAIGEGPSPPAPLPGEGGGEGAAGAGALAVGAPVFGVTRFGGYASRVVVPRAQVFARPGRLSALEAAALPTAFLTAYYALFELAAAKAGARVLVHSAAGGVGSALLQLCRASGVRAFGVVGAAHKVAAALEFGAEAVVDKGREALWPAARAFAPEGFDAAFDANGHATLRESYRHLAPTGRLVVYGFHAMMPRRGGRPNYLALALSVLRTPRFSPLALTGDNKAVFGFNLSYLFDRSELLRAAMARLVGWLEAGDVAPPRVRAYPVERVADAHRDLESGATVGKLVLTFGA